MFKLKSSRTAFFSAILIVVALTQPAEADFTSSNKWFSNLSQDERTVLQGNLVLIGHYNGLADGIFGQMTFKALTDFQVEIGEVPTGILTRKSKRVLSERSNSIYTELGFKIVKDNFAKLSMLMPASLLRNEITTDSGVRYFSDDNQIELLTMKFQLQGSADSSFKELHDAIAESFSGISYNNFKSDLITISGHSDGFNYYVSVLNNGHSAVGFKMMWTDKYRTFGPRIATWVASLYYPLESGRLGNSQEVAAAPESDGATPPSAASEKPQPFSGTGFFVANDGILVTNQHVVEGCTTLEVKGFGSAKLITSDKKIDLAVLQLQRQTSHAVAPIRDSGAQLGEELIVLGYPLAGLLNSSLNVGTGIVSAETGASGEDSWFTTNVGIQPGNSGGPILDMEGYVVGVAVAKFDDQKLLAEAGVVAPNVGFAIENTQLLKYLKIFRLPDHPSPIGTTRKVKEIVETARRFTVQVTCSPI
jgi:serine protease Do